MPIYSIPSLRQPESISPQFYFTSQSFISKAQSDIDLLLNTWVQSAKSNQLHSLSQNNNSSSNHQRNKLGPFLKFKSIYSRLGWIYVHLSVVDPALRKHWFNTIIRLFLSNLKPENKEPLKQVGVLFGLWCFWGTQPDSSVLGPNHYIVVDPEILDYICQIPSKFSSHLDLCFKGLVDASLSDESSSNSNPSHLSRHSSSTHSVSIKHRAHLDPNIFGPPPISAKPSDALHQVLKNLIDQDAFLIQPTQIALVYPPLPTNSISFSIAPTHHIQSSNQNSQASLSDSTIHLDPIDQNHTHSPQHNSTISSEIPELILSTKNEISKLIKIENKLLCDPDELNQIRSTYLSSKKFLTDPNYQHPKLSSELRLDDDQVQEEEEEEISDVNFTKDLFVEAIGMTRKVIQKTGPGLDHLLFPNQPTTTTTTNDTPQIDHSNQSHNHQSMDAFLLVDHAQSVPQLSQIFNPQT